MIKYKNGCVGCPKEIGCLGTSCPYINVKHLYCDSCQDDVECLYEYNGEQLCQSCLLKEFPKLEIDNDDYLE